MAEADIAMYEEKAAALLQAYRLGTPEALERHYRLTWHRRAWPAMRTYVQLDLGKRPSSPGADVEINLDDARYLIAREHGFADWSRLVGSVSALQPGKLQTAAPIAIRASSDEGADAIINTRDWERALGALSANPHAVLEAHGQMTDAMLRDLGRFPAITSLRLGGSKAITDDGVREILAMPNLRELDLSGTGVTDVGLAHVANLPKLERLSLGMTRITDASAVHLRRLSALRHLNLSWTHTGDEMIRALAGSPLTHLWSGNDISDEGLLALRDLPMLARALDVDVKLVPLTHDSFPNQLTLRGSFTDAGVDHLRGLNGLFGLALDGAGSALTSRAMRSLAALPNLGWLSVDAKDDWMEPIAELPVLRSLSAQDTDAGDDGFTALSRSTSLERIWGRRCHNLGTRGFIALSRMPSLHNLSVSCLNVGDDGIATLADFPSLRELMPMDIPDAGYRHIARCVGLEGLTLMYCRDTTDAATEHVVALPKLKRYFNSYTTITDRTPRLLSRMDSLEQVIFDECHALTNAGIAELARLPKLVELRVSGRGVTPEVRSAFPATVKVAIPEGV